MKKNQKKMKGGHQRKKSRRRRQIMLRRPLSSPRLATKQWCAPPLPHPRRLSLQQLMTKLAAQDLKLQHRKLRFLMTVLAKYARQRTVRLRSRPLRQQAQPKERLRSDVVQKFKHRSSCTCSSSVLQHICLSLSRRLVDNTNCCGSISKWPAD